MKPRIRENSFLNSELEWTRLQENELPKGTCSEVMIALLKDGVPAGGALHIPLSLQKGVHERSFKLPFLK